METLQAVHSERFSNYFLQLDQLLKNMARILNIQMLTSFQKTENIKINFLKFLTENCQMTLKRSHLRAFLNKIWESTHALMEVLATSDVILNLFFTL